MKHYNMDMNEDIEQKLDLLNSFTVKVKRCHTK